MKPARSTLPRPTSRTMDIYPFGRGHVIGAQAGQSAIWWHGGGVASEGLCQPKILSKREAMRVLPEAKRLLERSRSATY